MIAGVTYETIYFYMLIICAVLAVLLVFFGDVLEIDGPVDPMLLVPWLAFIGLAGYLGERYTNLQSWLILLIGGAISTILVFLMNFYIIVPMKQAEATISISEKDMEGRVATVITPIPVKGMGEIQFKSVTGSLSRPAAFYSEQESEAPNGSEVLIIEIRDRVCYVVPYEGSLKI